MVFTMVISSQVGGIPTGSVTLSAEALIYGSSQLSQGVRGSLERVTNPLSMSALAILHQLRIVPEG